MKRVGDRPRTLRYPTVVLMSMLTVTACGMPSPAGWGSSTAPSGAAPVSPAKADAAASPAQSAGPGAAGGATPSSPAAAPRYAFPVAGGSVTYIHDHHDYPATDLIAPCGRQVRAVTDAVVLEVSRVDRFDPDTSGGAERGGLFVSLLGDDGVRYYSSHLSKVSDGLSAGVRVRVGQQIGAVGRTGNANNICHLHFGISPPCARTGDWWNRRGVLWPWRYLDSWRAGGSRSPVAAVVDWQREHGCPAQP